MLKKIETNNHLDKYLRNASHDEKKSFFALLCDIDGVKGVELFNSVCDICFNLDSQYSIEMVNQYLVLDNLKQISPGHDWPNILNSSELDEKYFHKTAQSCKKLLNSIEKFVDNEKIIAFINKSVEKIILNVMNRVLDISELDSNYCTVEFNRYYYDIINALIDKDKEKLFTAIDMHISSYKKNSKKTLTLDEKIEIFFHDSPQMFGGNFLHLLIKHYDKEIFFEFMNKYSIPFNIPLRVTSYVSDDDDDITQEYKYMSINEYASTINSALPQDMVLAGIDVWEHFNHTVKIDNVSYHYKYQPYCLAKDFSENTVCKMINNGIIDKNLSFDTGSIFHQLLNNHFYVAFEKLYEISDIVLKDSYPELLNTYLKTKNSNNVELPILNIFVQEGFDITYNNHAALDILNEHNDTYAFSKILFILEPLFPTEYKQINFKPVETKTELVDWYDAQELKVMKDNFNKEDSTRYVLVEKILKNHPNKKPLLKIEDESFFNELEEFFPNFKEVIDFYKGQFRQNYYSNKKRISPILLLGEPGIGKTYFSKELARHLKTAYAFVDMGSLTNNWALTGINSTWQDARQGKILDLMMKSPTFNPIVLLDEIDKTGDGRYNPTVALYRLLEEVNAKEFIDEFIDFKFDMSGIIYIACANTINNLPEPLLSRFKVFHVPTPNTQQLEVIIKNIYQENSKDNPLLAPELDSGVMKNLMNNSLREVKILIEEGVTNALLEHSKLDLNKMIFDKKTLNLRDTHFRDKKKRVNMGF